MASTVATTSLRTEEPVNPMTMTTTTVTTTTIVTVTTTVTTTVAAPTTVVGHSQKIAGGEVEIALKSKKGNKEAVRARGLGLGLLG